jgi:hypothetical protein
LAYAYDSSHSVTITNINLQKFLIVIGFPVTFILLTYCLTGSKPSTSRPSYKPPSQRTYSAPAVLKATSDIDSRPIRPSLPPPAYTYGPTTTQSATVSTPAPTTSNCGFFDSFSESSYAAFLRDLDNTALLKKEKSKMMANLSSGAGVTGSAISAIASGGLTSPLILVSGRQAYLANKKLPLIRAEMERRGLRARDLTTGEMVRAVGPRVITSSMGLHHH